MKISVFCLLMLTSVYVSNAMTLQEQTTVTVEKDKGEFLLLFLLLLLLYALVLLLGENVFVILVMFKR